VIYVLVTKDITPLNQAIMLFATGLLGASNINVAHELGHKLNSELDYTLSMITMAKCLYAYWVPEHLHGHHKNVATPIDPATSRKN